MKKLFIAMLILVTSLFGDMKWMEYDDALEMSQKTGKTVMVMLSQKGCPACEYMQDIVFEDKKVLAELNENFLVVYLDIYTSFLEDGLTYAGTPTFYFLDKDEKKLDVITGGLNVRDFMEKLKAFK